MDIETCTRIVYMYITGISFYEIPDKVVLRKNIRN